MTRNLKALGLAVVAMFAMSALAATAAQAEDEGQIVSAIPTTGEHVESLVTGTDENEENSLVFTGTPESEPGVTTIECAKNEFHGTIGEGGTQDFLTVTPTFGGALAGQECTAGGLPATVTNNDCHLTFNTLETDGEETWAATADLECPTKPVEVHIYAGGAHGFTVCTLTVPSQSGLEGVTIHNNANNPHDLTVTVDVTNQIKETQSGLCGASETEEADFVGEVTLEAREHGGLEEKLDLYVEHKP